MWLWNVTQPEAVRKKTFLAWPTHDTWYEGLTFEGMSKSWRTADCTKCKWEFHVEELFPQNFQYFLLLNICSRAYHLFLLWIYPGPKVSASENWGTVLRVTCKSYPGRKKEKTRQQRGLLVFLANKSWGQMAYDMDVKRLHLPLCRDKNNFGFERCPFRMQHKKQSSAFLQFSSLSALSVLELGSWEFAI